MKRTIKAGMAPTKKRKPQADGPPADAKKYQAAAASSDPHPKADCIMPWPLARARVGQVSAIRVAPVAHSAPSPMPVSNLQIASSGQFWTKAVRPLNIA